MSTSRPSRSSPPRSSRAPGQQQQAGQRQHAGAEHQPGGERVVGGGPRAVDPVHGPGQLADRPHPGAGREQLQPRRTRPRVRPATNAAVPPPRARPRPGRPTSLTAREAGSGGGQTSQRPARRAASRGRRRARRPRDGGAAGRRPRAADGCARDGHSRTNHPAPAGPATDRRIPTGTIPRRDHARSRPCPNACGRRGRATPTTSTSASAGTIAAWTARGVEVAYCIATYGDAGGFDDTPRERDAGAARGGAAGRGQGGRGDRRDVPRLPGRPARRHLRAAPGHHAGRSAGSGRSWC